MKPGDLLREARELLSVAERWTKEGAFLDAAGRARWPGSPTATCFCMVGAVHHVQHLHGAEHYLAARDAVALLRDVLGPGVALVLWNDAPERTHAEVLVVFDRAIALADGGAR